MRNPITPLVRRLDAHAVGWSALAAAGGLAILAFGLFFGATATTEVGGAVLTGALLSAIGGLSKLVDSPASSRANSALMRASTIGVSLVLAACLILGRAYPTPPQLYYVLASIVAGLIGLQIVICPLPRYRSLILLEIVVLAVLVRAVLLFAFPSLFGTDTWAHAGAIEDWAEAGRLLKMGPHGDFTYYSYPVTYLHTISLRLAGGIGLKPSLFFAVSLPLSFIALPVYCIARELAGEKAGLMAALVTSFNQFLVVWGAFTIPTVVGVVLFCFVMLLTVGARPVSLRWPLFMLIALALVWTHTISSFVTAISGAGFATAIVVGAWMEQRRPGRILTFAPVAAVFFLAAMLQHWLYAYYPDTPFFARTLSPFWHALGSDTTLLGTPFEPAPSMLNRVSFLALIALAVWGGTGWLRPQARTPVRTAWIVAALCVAALMFGFTSIGIRNLIPQRWLAFAFVLAAPAIGRALSTISESVRPLNIGVGVTVLVIAVWAWFSLNTNFVNLNTPFYDVNTRYPYTESEQAAFAHIVTVHDGTTITDRVLWGDYAQYVAPSALVYPLEADTQISTVDSLFAIRQYARSQPDLMGEVARLESMIPKGQRLSVIYSNVQVELLLTQGP